MLRPRRASEPAWELTMPQPFEFKQSGHLIPRSQTRGQNPNAARLIGRWLNANRETQGIAEIGVEQDGEQFSVSILGVGADGLIDWPQTGRERWQTSKKKRGSGRLLWRRLSTLATCVRRHTCGLIKASSSSSCSLAFSDQSGRANYVNREFYYREG